MSLTLGTPSLTWQIAPCSERASATRLNVEFTQADLALGSWRGSLSLSFVQPKGSVETTYLDADGLRLGRGDKGSIFVAKRGPPPQGIDD